MLNVEDSLTALRSFLFNHFDVHWKTTFLTICKIFDDLNVNKTAGTLTITDGGGYAIKVYNSVSKSNNGSITFNCNFYV